MKIIIFCKRVLLIFVILVSLLFVGLPVILATFNPMQRPRFMVRNSILRLTPMGTHIDEAIEAIESRSNWIVRFVNHNRGFVHPSVLPFGSSIIGDKSIRVDAGPFWPGVFPLIGLISRESVSIFWGFDADGYLIEVYVTRTYNW